MAKDDGKKFRSRLASSFIRIVRYNYSASLYSAPHFRRKFVINAHFERVFNRDSCPYLKFSKFHDERDRWYVVVLVCVRYIVSYILFVTSRVYLNLENKK